MNVADKLQAAFAAVEHSGCITVQTLLVVDDDLAFVFWLGLGLEDAGFQAVPAKNATAARALVGQLGEPIKVVVVNPGLPGAARLVREFRRRYPELKVIAAVMERPEAAPALPGADAVLKKPDDLSAEAKTEWLAVIRNLAGQGACKHAQ